MNDFGQVLEKEFHLRDYLRVIYERKYILLICFTIINAGVMLVTFTASPLYEASAKLLIEKSNVNPLSSDILSNRDPEFIETQAHIIRSAPVSRKVVKLLNLEQTYASYFPNMAASLSRRAGDDDRGWFTRFIDRLEKFSIPSIGEAAPLTQDGRPEASLLVDKLAMVIRKTITVRPVRDSRVVEVSYMSTNPELSKRLANAVSKAYIEKILDMHMQSSGDTITWMTQKADQVRHKLEKSEVALQRYMKANNIITIEDRIALMPRKLNELSSQYTQAEAERKELETLYHKVRYAATNLDESANIPAITDNQTIQALRAEIIKAEQNQGDLSKKYGPKHPMMKRAIAELVSLRGKLIEEIGRMINMVKNQYELAEAKEQNFSELLITAKKSAAHLNEKSVQYGILKREVETNRKIYNALVSKIKEQGVTEQIQNINVSVVEQAVTPMAPTKPSKQRNLMLGLVLGLVGGLGVCFFIEYFDNTIKMPIDARERLGLPVLGLVTQQKDKNGPLEKVMVEAPESVLAEDFKTIRASVMLSWVDHPPKSLLVTSMTSNEGKTVTAVNLAIAIAQTDKNVLLIDADLRCPRIHKIFDLQNTLGLTTYLDGTSDEKKMIHKGPVPNLDIITAGPSTPSPSEILSSRRFEKLVKANRHKFDMVIVDSAPVMTVSDSLILSRLLDHTVVVALAGKTRYDMVRNGLTKLRQIRATVLGLVVNGVQDRQREYYS